MTRNAPAVDRRSDTVIELLRRNAAEIPNEAATCHRAASGAWIATSWSALWNEAQRVAGELRQRGLHAGDRLGILARTCREWQVTELGALIAGASVAGIDPLASRDEIARVIRHANLRGVAVDRRDRLDGVRTDGVEFVMVLGEAVAGPKGPAYAQAYAEGPAYAKGPAYIRSEDSPTPSWPMMVIYTSGTTGAPKGIEYSQAEIMTACSAMLDAFPEVQRGRFVCWLPLSALFQRMMNVMAIATRSTTYFVEDPRDIMSRLGEIRPTVLTSVPRFYEKVHDGMQVRIAAAPAPLGWTIRRAMAAGAEWSACVRKGERPGFALRARHAVADALVLRRLRAALGGEIELLISGSASAPVWLLEFFHGIGLLVFEAYGITENPVPVAVNRPGTYRFGSVGRPLAPNRVRIAQDGEVLVRGPAVFRGYLDEGFSPDHFTPDGEYRTGDYGHLDADGFLYLTGRKSELIKTTTGRRVPPSRVEAAYARSRHIDQVVVFGNNRPYLTALVALNRAAVTAALAEEGVSLAPDADLSIAAPVRNLVEREFAVLGQDLASHERVHAFAVLREPLSLERGELTSTLKLRRAVIHDRHAGVIDALYGRDADRTAAGARW